VRVMIAGPDGAGKSSLVAALSQALSASGRPCAALHFGRAVADADRPVAPHARRLWPAPVAHLRLLVRFPSFWRSAVRYRRPDLVVLEQRVWWDQVVDPARYRLPPSAGRLAALLARLLPRADLALLLCGDPAVLAGRKQELTAAETARQLGRWQRVIGRCARHWVAIDTTAAALDDCVATASEALASRGADG
jgi:energy-coupling factor transporter ATP-binding protein EcfA2